MKKLLLLGAFFTCVCKMSYAQCSKAIVTITGPSIINICEGTPVPLSGIVTATSAPVNGYTYSWIKTAVTGTTVQVPPTAITLPPNTGTSVTDYTGITGLIADAGTYVLRVEDGNVGNSACYTEASVVVKVNPMPTITSATTGIACTGVAQNYEITSNVPATYNWTCAGAAGITGALGSGSTSPITETLFNTTNAPIVIRYTITPTSAASCIGTSFNYDVTVMPPVLINSSATGSVCSGEAQNYEIKGNIAASYAWKRAAVAGISNAAATGTSSTITEALTNTTDQAIVVRYLITPTSATGNCPGWEFTYDVTVNPKPTITSASKETICTGVPLNYLITSNVPSTYRWTRAAVTGITPAPGAASSANTITETLNGSSTVDVAYTIIPTSTTGGCVGVPFTHIVTVSSTAVPTVAITTNPGTNICAGTTVTFSTTITSGGTTPTYQWQKNSLAIVGETNSTYSSSSLANGDQISVVIMSSLSCASPKAATVTVTMTVNPNITPSVTVAADKTSICPGDNVTFTATPTNGGTPTYQWKKNGTTIPGATNATHTTLGTILGSPNSVTVEMLSTALCAPTIPVASSPVIVTVTPAPVASVSIMVDKSSTCAGNPVTYTAIPTNGGTPTYEWYIGSPGAEVSQGAPSTVSNTFTTTSLTPTINSVYVKMGSSLACANTAPVRSSNIIMTVLSGIGAGTIGSDQTICYASSPAQITETTAPTGTSGSLVYMWEISPTGSGGSFVTVTGETNASYTPSPLTQDRYIRRTIIDPTLPAPCNTATSNVVHITVRPQLTAGVINGDQTICAGTAPAAFTSAGSPAGGTGTFTYQWQSDVAGTFADIAGATNATYAPGVLTTTTKFQRAETSGACGTVTSNIVTITVIAPETVTASINDPGQVCAGSAAFTFTATASTTGTGTLNYEWYINGISAPVSTTSTYTYNPVIADNNKTIKAVVKTSNGCNTGPAISNSVTLDIVSSTTPTVSITTSNNPTCESFSVTFTATSTDAGNSPTYLWYINNMPVGSGITGTATQNTLTTSSLVNGDQVWVELTSNHGCLIGSNPFASNKITMAIKPIPTPVINEGDQTICAGNSLTFTSTVSAGSTYQWSMNGIDIAGATNDTYTANLEGTYSLLEDNGTCNLRSEPATLTIDPCGAFSTSITGPNSITPGQQNVAYRVADQAGFTYEWSITGGTIVSGQHTNSVTVDWDPAPVNAIARTTMPAYSISVTETNPNKQSKTTTLEINELTTGVTKSLAQAGITLFPNPTAESFSIEMPESGVAVNYEIVDLTGASVAQGNFISTGNAEKITTDFGAGIYQVILRYNNTVTSGRLSKVQ